MLVHTNRPYCRRHLAIRRQVHCWLRLACACHWNNPTISFFCCCGCCCCDDSSGMADSNKKRLESRQRKKGEKEELPEKKKTKKRENRKRERRKKKPERETYTISFEWYEPNEKERRQKAKKTNLVIVRLVSFNFVQFYREETPTFFFLDCHFREIISPKCRKNCISIFSSFFFYLLLHVSRFWFVRFVQLTLCCSSCFTSSVTGCLLEFIFIFFFPILCCQIFAWVSIRTWFYFQSTNRW